MKFGYTILYVPDVKKTLSFYERAFGMKCRFADETGRYGELDTGATALAFASESLIKENGLKCGKNRADKLAAAIEIAFVTTNVASAVKRAVKAGATAVKPPTKKPWGQTVAYVRDLNGVLVELCTPMGG